MSASCLYEGTIRHRRDEPRHEFRHRLALAYIDLAEVPSLLAGRLVAPRPGLVRFRRQDYHGDPAVALDQAVRDTVASATGLRPEGPVRILTQLRSYGHCFNPVSLYYCLRPREDRVEALIAEVTNTPWGERHAYVFVAPDGDSTVLRGQTDKALHVSPFMGMDHTYAVNASTPGSTLAVHIASLRHGQKVFEATLGLERLPLTRSTANRMAVRYPMANARVLALIYGRAARLKFLGAPLHRHPHADRA
jgi:DUF1365 family protein